MQVTVNQIWQIFRSVAASVSTHSRLIRQLHTQQRTSASQDEWMDLAEKIDYIQGNDVSCQRNGLLFTIVFISFRCRESDVRLSRFS